MVSSSRPQRTFCISVEASELGLDLEQLEWANVVPANAKEASFVLYVISAPGRVYVGSVSPEF